MKVIAINDSPLITLEDELAYYKGDIFELLDETPSRINNRDYILIYHSKLESNMLVDTQNFITLEEWRELQIDKII
jgi:hypothetical protein